jgi:hypothetical protein
MGIAFQQRYLIKKSIIFLRFNDTNIYRNKGKLDKE